MALFFVPPLLIGLAIQLPDWLGITAALVSGGVLAILVEKFRRTLLFKGPDLFVHSDYPD